MGDVKYTKVQTHPHKPIEVRWTEMVADGSVETMSLKSKAMPRPELLAAMDALVPAVAHMMGLPQDYLSAIVDITVQDKKGEDGIRIVAQAKIPRFEDPVTIISPKIIPGDERFLAALDDVWVEAGKYVVGQRAQGELEFSGERLDPIVEETICGPED